MHMFLPPRTRVCCRVDPWCPVQGLPWDWATHTHTHTHTHTYRDVCAHGQLTREDTALPRPRGALMGVTEAETEGAADLHTGLAQEAQN